MASRRALRHLFKRKAHMNSKPYDKHGHAEARREIIRGVLAGERPATDISELDGYPRGTY